MDAPLGERYILEPSRQPASDAVVTVLDMLINDYIGVVADDEDFESENARHEVVQKLREGIIEIASQFNVSVMKLDIDGHVA